VQGDPGCFFGYFDKSPWSPCSRYYLLHVLSEESGGRVRLACYDFETNDTTVFQESRAWNYQQGCMLQWQPGDGLKVVFNDVVGRRLVARIVDPFSGTEEALLDAPIQVLSPDGKTALSLNYKRLYRLRPEYGYAPEVNNFSADMEPTGDGIWKVDLLSGTTCLILSLEQLTTFQPRQDMRGAAHKVNHLLYSPGGERFAFMHRWIGPKGKFSRLYTANADGSDLRLLADDRMVSHYAWKDSGQLLAWARKEPWGDHYYLFEDPSGTFRIIGEGVFDLHGDGHPGFSPDGRWIVTDTYPDKARMRALLLWDTHRERVVTVGRFFAPWRFDEAQRCDLHPRWHPNGKMLSIDSVHEGIRRTYVINVEQIVAS